MKILQGDCLEVLKTLEDNSVDSIVTDPPYGLSFMGKKWDYDVPSVDVWRECLRVLKPGGHLLSFAGTRTQHRMACNIEDAGFDIRDMIAWVYGSGFPKSLNIGKAVDKLQKNEREVIGENPNRRGDSQYKNEYTKGLGQDGSLTKGTSEWEGWGTALKPAIEPITLARKPLSEKTIAENCLKWGTGGINIDGCRVGTGERYNAPAGNKAGGNSLNMSAVGIPQDAQGTTAIGRFPANLIHDNSEEVRECFPEAKGATSRTDGSGVGMFANGNKEAGIVYQDNQTNASRFFKSIIYQAKASKSERNKGCEELDFTRHADRQKEDGSGGENPRNRTNTPKQNFHPTVKPITLMEYLIKMVTQKGGTVLDPFMGSGSTGIACKQNGYDFIGIEKEEDYIKIAEARINSVI